MGSMRLTKVVKSGPSGPSGPLHEEVAFISDFSLVIVLVISNAGTNSGREFSG